VWDSTLAAITRKHPDLPSFLQLFAGYSVQGNKVEERIFSLHEPGGTGKGTFNDAISSTLGDDYVRAIAPETVLRQNRNSAAASGDIARLEGARIVIVSELEKGNRVQESFLKLASGNDFVVARGLFKSERQFRPTWQFWFQTNNRLGFDSTDSGNLRRYVEIPFDNVLGHDLQIKFDRNLKSWMRSNDEFHCTVLVWIVAGCVRWRQEGMKIPVSVQRATQELFASNDFLRDFINERCVVGPTEKELVSKVIAEYVAFCVEQGEEPARGRTFNHMLEERGFCRKQATVRGTNGKAWIGIRLKTAKELERDGFVDVTESEKRPRKPNDKATLDDYFDADQSLAG
jgi:putative DNA primase/helicase